MKTFKHITARISADSKRRIFVAQSNEGWHVVRVLGDVARTFICETYEIAGDAFNRARFLERVYRWMDELPQCRMKAAANDR